MLEGVNVRLLQERVQEHIRRVLEYLQALELAQEQVQAQVRGKVQVHLVQVHLGQVAAIWYRGCVEPACPTPKPGLEWTWSEQWR